MPKRRPNKLRRRRHVRQPKKRFVLYCEGKNTEPNYFRALRTKYNAALVEIETNAAIGVPYTIAENAVKRARSLGVRMKRRTARDSFEDNDEVWAIFDRDDHPRFNEAVQYCEDNGVKVGRSNPCFEVWLILHDTDCDRPDGRVNVQRYLSQLRPEYEKDGMKIVDYAELLNRVDDAEFRAEQLLGRRLNERSPFGRPSTTIFQLTRAIKEAVSTQKNQ